MGYSEAQKRATAKYKTKAYKRIPLEMKMEEYDEMKAYTEKTGETINGFIRRLIREELDRGGQQ